MPSLKYRDPADGQFKDLVTATPEEVVISATEPTDLATDLWLDPTAVSVDTRWADGVPRFATNAERDAAYAGIGGPALGMMCFVADLTLSVTGLTYQWSGARWDVIAGGTGWRNITSLLINGWTTSGGYVNIRRDAKRIWLKVYSITAPATWDATKPCMLPIAGFLPSTTVVPVSVGSAGGMLPNYAQVVESSGFLINGAAIATSEVVRINVEYATDYPWPTTLPGTPI